MRNSLKSQAIVPDGLFIEYHRDSLLKKGKLRNYDKREGKQLDELELLADLQHHQAATCLLDFTRNALVALWFACGETDKDGKVFVVNTGDERNFLEVTPEDMTGTSIEDILRFKTRSDDVANPRATPDLLKGPEEGSKFWYWTPAHLNERITAQDSLFIFAPPSSGKPSCDEIIVELGDKRRIRQELEHLYNIREESLFPDFVGFAYTQRHEAPATMPDAEEYRNRGIEAHQRGEYAQAIEFYNKAIERNPKYVDAYLSRGNAYDNVGQHELAMKDFDEALESDSSSVLGYLARGSSHAAKGDHDLAIRDFSDALGFDPNNPFIFRIRGFAYGNRGEYDLAIQDYDKSLDLEPDDAFTHLLRGSAYSDKGHYDSAIQDLDKVLAANLNNVPARLARGLAYFRMGEKIRAVEDLNRVLASDPSNIIAYLCRGNVNYSNSDLAGAIQDFNKVLTLDKDNGDAYFDRSLVWMCMSKWGDARSDLTEAKSKGHQVQTTFHRMYGSVAHFEQRHNVKLPSDMAIMLTS